VEIVEEAEHERTVEGKVSEEKAIEGKAAE
jgi:hypothetical protein